MIPAGYSPRFKIKLIACPRLVALPDLFDYNDLYPSTLPGAGQVIFIPGIPREKVLYLPFDDGPHEEWTAKFLDLLARFQAHATFFVIGRNASLYPTLIQQEIDEGHAATDPEDYRIGVRAFLHKKPAKVVGT